MADLFPRDTELVLIIATCAIFIVLPIQLALCIKTKKLFIKRLPAAIFAAVTVTFYTLAITAKTWIAFMYLIIAVFSGVFLIFCGIAWLIWLIIKLIKRKNRNFSNFANPCSHACKDAP